MNRRSSPSSTSEGETHDWAWPDVKAALEKAGSSFSQLARKYDVDVTSITQAKTRHLPKSQKRIADAIGLSPQEIWPDRYRKAATVKSKRTRSTTDTRKGSRAA